MPGLLKALVPNPWGGTCWYVRETTSTMEEARSLEERGEPSGSLVRADAQTAGRGRHPQRSWHSPEAQSLLFTAFWEASAFANLPFAPSLVLALGVCRWVESLSGTTNPRVKWPNDVYWNDRKLGGILVQTRVANDRIGTIHAGIGINLRQQAFEGEFRRFPTSLAIEGYDVDAPDALSGLLPYLAEAMRDSDPRGQVQRRLWRLSESYEIEVPATVGPTIERGRLIGLAERGELLLETNEGVKSFVAGE